MNQTEERAPNTLWDFDSSKLAVQLAANPRMNEIGRMVAFSDAMRTVADEWVRALEERTAASHPANSA